jgi:hypothetical protein
MIFRRFPTSLFLLPLLGIAFSLIFGEILVRVLGLGPHLLDPLFIPKYQLSDNSTLVYEYRPNYPEWI